MKGDKRRGYFQRRLSKGGVREVMGDGGWLLLRLCCCFRGCLDWRSSRLGQRCNRQSSFLASGSTWKGVLLAEEE
jgi:hypothetical protein